MMKSPYFWPTKYRLIVLFKSPWFWMVALLVFAAWTDYVRFS